MANTEQASFLSGVIEGFYGRTWTTPQRFHLLEQLPALGLNTYFYAPKDDLKHRAIWRERYDADEWAEFRELIRKAKSHGVEFIYGLSPGLDLRFTDGADRQRICDRLTQLIDEGVRSFALLFDDLPGQLSEADVEAFSSLAAAQCDVVNATAEWLRAQRADSRLLFCPTPYCDQMDRQGLGGAEYLDEIGRRLRAEIEIFWTGPEIVSPQISVESIERIAQRLRRPPVLWDNLFANDYDLHRLHCGPYAGRARVLREHVRGILINPNNEYWANAIPLHTFANYITGEGEWDPESEYRSALEAWHVDFRSVRTPMQLDDLRLLTDCFYLPNTVGETGQRLRELIVILKNESHPERDAAYGEFQQLNQRIQRAFESLTELHQRELFHAWSRYGWQLKEQLLWLDAYFARGQRAAGASDAPAPLRGSMLAQLESWIASSS